MYWYMKYPMIAMLALAVLGGGWLLWRGGDQPATPKQPESLKALGSAASLYSTDIAKPPAPPVPEVTPVPATLPIPEAKPEVKPVVPVVEVKPEVKPVVPVVEVKPEVKPAVPVVEAKPEVKPVVPVVEAKPEVKPAVPAVEAKPEVKPAVPVVEAKPEVKPVVPAVEVKPIEPTTPFGKQLQQAVALANHGEYVKARETIELLMANPEIKMFDPRWMAASEKLSALNSVFVNTDLRCPEKVPYTVKEGEVLIKIAYRNGTTVEQLTKNNPALQKPKAVIHPDQTLYILKGDWKLVAYKSKFLMLVYNGDKLFKVYAISIGKDGRTPLGSFLIDDKVKEPPFQNIPYSGDDKTGNPLGTRWMRLKTIEETPADLKGYGIHGTWEPDSLGKPASNGCLRMANSDVEELFDFLPMKADTVRVEIKE
jgi:hypothetical protein